MLRSHPLSYFGCRDSSPISTVLRENSNSAVVFQIIVGSLFVRKCHEFDLYDIIGVFCGGLDRNSEYMDICPQKY